MKVFAWINAIGGLRPSNLRGQSNVTAVPALARDRLPPAPHGQPAQASHGHGMDG